MKRFEICEINLNEGEGRQVISWDTEDGMLYSSACDEAVDGYTYETLDEAVEACDVSWGRSDICGVWDLKWIEHDEMEEE